MACSTMFSSGFLITAFILSEIFCQTCDNDDFKKFKALIDDRRRNFDDTLNRVLDGYDDFENVYDLVELVNDNDSVDKSLEVINKNLYSGQDQLRTQLKNIGNAIDGLHGESLDFPDNYENILNDAKKLLGETVDPITLKDVVDLEKKLIEWEQALNKLFATFNNALNLPHAISAEIESLENAINSSTFDCVSKVEEKASELFGNLANVLKQLDGILKLPENNFKNELNDLLKEIRNFEKTVGQIKFKQDEIEKLRKDEEKRSKKLIKLFDDYKKYSILLKKEKLQNMTGEVQEGTKKIKQCKK